jgi:lipopolysaccharide transport system ATP-binding protein
MSDAIIQVENLGKRYRIAHQGQRRGYVALRDVIAHKLAAPFRALRRRGPRSETLGQSSNIRPSTSRMEDFWALKNVSFEVKRGEVVGIIGRNGAGKSTLLKILSRITEPTEGRVRLRARVASLLEVGTGFHPELTGRENIFLNGAILGMHRAEIKRKFEEIVDFAEVAKFLDTPVKHFSSGMYVRLAFSVAAHLEPEILIVDEVLAVGDAEFQRKCLGKMQDVSTKEGRTVLFVSHNMLMVRRLCSRAILLSSGRITAQGDTSQILKHYQAVALPQQGRRDWPDLGGAPGSEICRIRRIRTTDEAGIDIGAVDVSARFIVEMVFDVLLGGHSLVPNFHFFNEEGQCLFVAQDLDPVWRSKPRPAGRFCCRLVIPENFLAEGRLTVGGAVTTFVPFFVHGYAQDAIAVVIEDSCNPRGARGDYAGPLPGVVRPLLETSNEYSPFSATTTLAHV